VRLSKESKPPRIKTILQIVCSFDMLVSGEEKRAQTWLLVATTQTHWRIKVLIKADNRQTTRRPMYKQNTKWTKTTDSLHNLFLIMDLHYICQLVVFSNAVYTTTDRLTQY